MVRRMKRELPPLFDGTPRFPVRELNPLEVAYSDQERAAHHDLTTYTKLRSNSATDPAERFATEFVLKLLKKRLFSSPAAFARTLAQHRSSLIEARRAKATSRVPVSVLRSQAERVEDSFDSDEEYEAAVSDAQLATARLFQPLSTEEEKILDRLAAWAAHAAARADSKAAALLSVVEDVCRPNGQWGRDRIIVFTEYRDTQRWLFDLMAARHLTENGRTALLHGGMITEQRSAVKAAFQADPDESPVRILLATDAASEGINLQNHCHRIVHYEIPWNPNRLEQRNGRVDRRGQRSPKVLVHHFVPAGWQRMKDVATVPVGTLEGELEFLRRAVLKIEEIREMLGKVGPVIADQVAEAMLGRRRTLDTAAAERDGENVRRRLRFERQLEEDLRRLERSYDDTRAEQQLTPDHIQATVETALALARQPQLESAGDRLWRLPRLTGAWARAAEGLAHPYTGIARPITFDPDVARGRDDLVLAHLGHRLVQMSLALLRAEIWRSGEGGSLDRVTARVVNDPRLREPVVVVHARLVVTGAGGHRLHEELVQAGGLITGGKLQRLGVGALEEYAKLPRGSSVRAATARRFLDLYGGLKSALLAAVDARAKERTASLARAIAQRRDDESAKVTAILEELRRQIVAELAEPESEQLALFDEDERDQRERDCEHLRARAEQIPGEIAREVALIAKRFADPQPRVFPVAVEFLVPPGVDRE